MFGEHFIDIGSVEQITDISQTRAIADAIYFARSKMTEGKTLGAVIEEVMKEIDEKGLSILSPHPRGDYAYFRGIELAAAINRMRGLEISQ